MFGTYSLRGTVVYYYNKLWSGIMVDTENWIKSWGLNLWGIEVSSIWGYVEANLKIPEIKPFLWGFLLLDIADSRYAQCMLIQIGTLHIDKSLELFTPWKWEHLSTCWKRDNLATLLANKASTTDTNSTASIPLESIQDSIKLTKCIAVLPFQTIHVSDITRVKCHNKRINVIMEPVNSKSFGAVRTVLTYTEIKPNACKVELCLRNLSARSPTLKAKTVITNLTAANAVPPKWALQANW